MPKRVVVHGCGRAGWHAAAALADFDDIELVLVDPRPGRADAVSAALGGRAWPVSQPGPVAGDVAVLCLPAVAHAEAARASLRAGSSVVSTDDHVGEVNALLDLGAEAARQQRTVLVGAGFSPGLSCLLARHAANLFDQVDEVHVCRSGTGGPACARQHHAALGGRAVDWREGRWVWRRGRSGRQLAHFPEPVGPRDCYRGALPDALLLHRAFPEASRLTARLAATRRDRLTAALPMLRRPHPDGGPGGTRVEVWGRRGGSREVVIYGAVGSPAEICGTMAAVATRWVLDGGGRAGAYGLSEVVDARPFLAALDERGVRVACFEGAS